MILDRHKMLFQIIFLDLFVLEFFLNGHFKGSVVEVMYQAVSKQKC